MLLLPVRCAYPGLYCPHREGPGPWEERDRRGGLGPTRMRTAAPGVREKRPSPPPPREPMTRSPKPPANPASRRSRDAPGALLHPRNRHQGRYDFARLTRPCPELSAFLVTTPAGEASIDFSAPDAIRALNRALLQADYGIAHWGVPDGYLVPPIPGRADYLHGLADLLAETAGGVIPRGSPGRLVAHRAG